MTEEVTQVKPALYCGTYAKYNNGSIKGAWMLLEAYKTPAEFFEACAQLHSDESDPEFMFQDFEGFPETLYSEAMNTLEAEKLLEYVHMDEEDRTLLDEYLEATGYSIEDAGSIEDIRDKLFCELDYTHSLDDENAMGDYVVENGLIDIPEHLQYYVDYRKIGQDYLQDMSVSSNGYVFTG